MTRCPACRSTKVYKGYRLAPLPLRMVRIHEYLCEGCNLQFRAFSLLPPKTRRRKHHPVKLVEDLAASSQTRGNELSDPKPAEVQAESPAGVDEPVSAGAYAASNAPAPGQINLPIAMPPQVPPQQRLAENESKEKIQVPKQNWEIPASSFETISQKKRANRSNQICPHCGTADTERRRRRFWEKAIFAFTDVRAYNCRICGGDFYARRKKQAEGE